MSEIVADYRQHVSGEREVMGSWLRPDGQTYFNVPVVYLREVSKADYLAQHPYITDADLAHHHNRTIFWEVSID